MSRMLLQFVVMMAAVLNTYTAAHADSNHLTLTGSSTMAPLVAEIARRYEQRHPAVRIDVQTGGSSRGIYDARMGLADIGMVSRFLKPNEHDLKAYLIALDGIGIIVNQSNPVTTLDKHQIIAIYTGNIRNWNHLSGRNLPITVVNKAEGHSTLELFLGHFNLRNSQIKAHIIIGDNQQGIKSVAGNAGAIGYVSVGAAEYEQSAGTPIKLLALDGVQASVEHVSQGDYPWRRPLNLVVNQAPSDLVSAFIHFAQSKAVQDLIKNFYFSVPVTEK